MGSSRSATVGTLLADIANSISDSLRILNLSDKRHWGEEEHDQVRALEDVLDEARKDFQEMSPLVNGQFQYENDRKYESIVELTALRAKFQAQTETLRDWCRAGGQINSIWIRETHMLQTDLHRAQYRAARRIFASTQESGAARCLGAWLLHRKHRTWSQHVTSPDLEQQRRQRDELKTCRRAGSFQKFGEGDVVFICDYCDGHLVWEDLERMPTARTTNESVDSPLSPLTPSSGRPYWQATGKSSSGGADKDIVFGPVAIANHTAPQTGDWQSGIICSFCEDEARKPVEVDDEEDIWHPTMVFEDIASFHEHLEWQHSGTVPGQGAAAAAAAGANGAAAAGVASSNSSCLIM
ncbi:hypothetical protein N3K66_006930 [Trichothecium roseum]|uniref:Uncharacterized protein n=1 Tax=Trichothecium roseum TaxID=47278 RepID=A0ACC0UYF1_9HYPO|nr:hypothetical protein N3K66_006930 [Trichothecium roseum]